MNQSRVCLFQERDKFDDDTIIADLTVLILLDATDLLAIEDIILDFLTILEFACS